MGEGGLSKNGCLHGPHAFSYMFCRGGDPIYSHFHDLSFCFFCSIPNEDVIWLLLCGVQGLQGRRN